MLACPNRPTGVSRISARRALVRCDEADVRGDGAALAGPLEGPDVVLAPLWENEEIALGQLALQDTRELKILTGPGRIVLPDEACHPVVMILGALPRQALLCGVQLRRKLQVQEGGEAEVRLRVRVEVHRVVIAGHLVHSPDLVQLQLEILHFVLIHQYRVAELLSTGQEQGYVLLVGMPHCELLPTLHFRLQEGRMAGRRAVFVQGVELRIEP
mmetsp:Transcript_25377/g.53665  ORF Transcript_25377/g.53665 Transcript_25377/m.53665 type:complete len:214 (-) Transcript_25377:481-1122(-)